MVVIENWVNQAEDARRRWDREGLSLAEARTMLRHPVFSVAYEAAVYIDRNWSMERISHLERESLSSFILMKARFVDWDKPKNPDWR